MTKKHIIVVDDQEVMRDSLAMTLERQGYRVSAFDSGETMKPLITSMGADMVITDLAMPEMDGIEVLRFVKDIDENIPVIINTAFGTIEKAVEAMKLGAFNFITKPFKAAEIEILVKKALEHSKLIIENIALKEELNSQYADKKMIASGEEMAKVVATINKIKSSNATVMIRGASGTGKEVVAREIHQQSNRADKPFIKVNCAALSAGVLESELFGHEKGAFTGAEKKRKGRFEIADGGTLLLDEISEMDLGLQAKLLRVLQEKEFEAVGSDMTKKVDVRILATSNRDLEDWVKQGKFREDLYFRLNVISIKIPNLAKRRDDITKLTKYFLEIKSRAEGLKKTKTISKDAMAYIQRYDWPGNVRELENTIERAVILSGECIELEDLGSNSNALANKNIQEAIPYGRISVAELEKDLILGTIKFYDGHREKSAKALGITSRTLREKLSKWKDD